MHLTSVTRLKLSKEQFYIIDTMSYRVKNLYNSSLYELNQNYKDNKVYIGFNKLDLIMKNHIENKTYNLLPSAIAQQTLKKLDKNYKSFFELLKKKNNDEYIKNVNTPKYLHKDSRKEIIYTKSLNSQSFIFKDNWIYITVSKDLNKGRLKLCRVPNYLKDKDFNNEIKYIEIIPKLNYYELHIKYEENTKTHINNMQSWMSIDLGINNLCTVTSNKMNAFILNGRGIKSINQKYNKQISKLKSETKKSQGKNTSKQIQSLYNKRGYKLNNEIHKITNFIVESVLEKKIDFVIIGYNKEWKQNINLGKKTNQNFVQIPFSKILNHLVYKLQLEGIEVILQEESYTSKTSYFDNEPIKKQQTYIGKRINRGLFKTGSGILINADVNGSLNIYRKLISTMKVVNDVLKEPVDTGLVMNPIKINLRTNLSLSMIIEILQSL